MVETDASGWYGGLLSSHVERDVRHGVLGLVRLEHHEVPYAALKITADIGIGLNIQCQEEALAGGDEVAFILRDHEANEARIVLHARRVLVVAVAQHIGRSRYIAVLVVLGQGHTLWQVQVELVEGDVLIAELAVD